MCMETHGKWKRFWRNAFGDPKKKKETPLAIQQRKETLLAKHLPCSQVRCLISVKRDLISVKRDLISVKRDLERDLISVKRDLKRELIRHLPCSQVRCLISVKRDLISVKRDLKRDLIRHLPCSQVRCLLHFRQFKVSVRQLPVSEHRNPLWLHVLRYIVKIRGNTLLSDHGRRA